MPMNSAVPSYLDEKEFSPQSFIKFVKSNMALAMTSVVVVLIVYGVRLANICFGIDTEVHLTVQRYRDWMQIGRFGLVGLQKLWTNFIPGKELFNPYLAVFLACVFLLAGSLLWCYVIDILSNGRIKKAAYIPFAVLFISHQVWVEQISFVLQAAECLFIIFLSPIAVYFLFDGAMRLKLKSSALGIFLTIFCASVYQSSLTLLLCGLLVAFVLFYENSNLSFKEQSLICARLAALFCASVAMYFAFNKTIQAFFHIEKLDYLNQAVMIGKQPLSETIKRLCRYVFDLVFAHSPFAAVIVARFAKTGWKAVEHFRETSLIANIVYAPAFAIYFFSILLNKKKSFFYVTAAAGIPLCTFIMPFIGGGDSVLRSQYALPFAFAFILLYVLTAFENYKYVIALTAFLVCGAKQCLVSAMLNYSDVIRYQADAHLCNEIAVRIKETNAAENVPVFFYGAHKPQFLSNYLKGEVCGSSSFEYAANLSIFGATYGATAFMQSQGYNVSMLDKNDEALIKKAFAAGKDMADFPRPGSVKNLGDVVIVRLSEVPLNAQTNK